MGLEKVIEIASQQGGYFLSTQAAEAGVDPTNHTKYVNSGIWERVDRGLYLHKSAIIQHDETSDYWQWYLWCRNRKGELQGVFSHETALSILGISDVNPTKISMIVPLTFRRSATIPEEIVIHRSQLKESDIQKYKGLKITTPFRTISDLIKIRKVSDELIERAIADAKKSGKISIPEEHWLRVEQKRRYETSR